MAYFALQYEVIDNYVDRRAAFREIHLGLATEYVERGELVLGGAFSDPVDGALLIFNCADRSVVENFLRDDPYVINGLVTRWSIREWNVVIGSAQT